MPPGFRRVLHCESEHLNTPYHQMSDFAHVTADWAQNKAQRMLQLYDESVVMHTMHITEELVMLCFCTKQKPAAGHRESHPHARAALKEQDHH